MFNIFKKSEYWSIGGNFWTKSRYSYAQALGMAMTMVKSRECFDCRDCKNCYRCFSCRGCVNCASLTNCSDCEQCGYCNDSSNLWKCEHCERCHGCKRCYQAFGISGFEDNPERIVSNRIGSRHEQTSVYWLGSQTQVVCGCFRGTLSEFKERVRVVYPSGTKYRRQYDSFIWKVDNFMF